MNIFVCVKQVPDTETKVTPNSDGSFIETSSVKWVMNPWDEFAVEQSLVVKSNNAGSTVTLLRVGDVKDSEALRTALAMGADEAILVKAKDNLDPFSTAKALKGAIEKSGITPDIIFCGMQAADDDAYQVPQILSEMLNLPCVTGILGYEQSGNNIVVKREIEGGSLEVYEVNTPCILSITQGLNTPRYASLPGIMKAKKKEIKEFSLSDVGVSENDLRLKYHEYKLPPTKPAGKKFDAMDEANQKKIVQDVVSLLRNEAKII